MQRAQARTIGEHAPSNGRAAARALSRRALAPGRPAQTSSLCRHVRTRLSRRRPARRCRSRVRRHSGGAWSSIATLASPPLSGISSVSAAVGGTTVSGADPFSLGAGPAGFSFTASSIAGTGSPDVQARRRHSSSLRVSTATEFSAEWTRSIPLCSSRAPRPAFEGHFRAPAPRRPSLRGGSGCARRALRRRSTRFGSRGGFRFLFRRGNGHRRDRGDSAQHSTCERRTVRGPLHEHEPESDESTEEQTQRCDSR